MHRVLLGLVAAMSIGAAAAQTPAASPSPAAPSAGSAGGGAVGASAASPTHPTGKTPPGTPSAATPAGRMARDSAGQKVIGHTATTSAIPGNTGGGSTGAK